MERQAWKEKMFNKEADDIEDDSEGDETPPGHGSGLITVRFEENEKQKIKASASAAGKKASGSGGGSAGPPSCQADRCGADLLDAKLYHRRHKVCEFHSKAAAVNVSGIRQRFCQQCSRFHEVAEFDEAKRSCRRRLAGHNERRRKSSGGEPYGEGSSRRGNISQYRPESQTSTKYHTAAPSAAPGNSANSKHYQIR